MGSVPNKTIYVSDDDMPLLQRAQEIAGGNMSSAIATALRRYVDNEDAKNDGFDEIVVRVGSGKGRPQRFMGTLIGEWMQSSNKGTETCRLYRTRKGYFAVHRERSEQYIPFGPNAEKWNTGWRAWIGDWSSNQTWVTTAAESTLKVAKTFEELQELIPDELLGSVRESLQTPDVEDLDI